MEYFKVTHIILPLGTISLPKVWFRLPFLKRWLMPKSCQYLRDIWPWPLITDFNLVSPELVRQLYQSILLGPFQLKYSILLYSKVLACCSLHGQCFPVYKHAEYSCRFLLYVRHMLKWINEGRGIQYLIRSHPAKILPLNSVTTGAGPVQT